MDSNIKRFFAFGCSHVNYHYPTWADIFIEDLRQRDIQGYNCGRTGSGNQLIANRIWELHAQKNFSKEDLIVISWSSFFREDRYHTGEGWHTPGNIFFHAMTVPMEQNKYVYRHDSQWKDILHYLSRDCAIITSTLEGLKNTGARVISTTMLDPYGDEALINFSDKTKVLLDIYKPWLYPEIIPIQNYCYYEGVGEDDARPKYRNTSDPDTWIIEDHPIPLEHLDYLKNVICKELDISLSKGAEDFANRWNRELYDNTEGYYPLKDWHPTEPKWIID